MEKKIEKYYSRRDYILFTRDTHYPDYLDTQEGKMFLVGHCIKDMWGWMICEEIMNKIANLGIRYPIFADKYSFGYGHWENHKYMLANSTEIELIGLCTDTCVIFNALILKAFFPDVKITVDVSCCAGTTPELHVVAIKVMKSCQVNVIGLS